MEAYISGSGIISAQETFEKSGFPENIRPLNAPFTYCAEPNYKDFIQPIQLRRMGRILRMGVTAAAKCLKDAGIGIPDAIITGTGLGLVQDTEKFLSSVIENDEKFLNPTSFIQSTHNTVGAHIAVMLRCNSYNCTYVHGNISFESALLDSLMLIADNPELKVLLGGHDEMTEHYFKISDSAGLWNKYYPDDRMPENPERAIVGEGAAFFLVSGKYKPGAYAKFSGVSTFYKPENTHAIAEKITGFLGEQGLALDDMDLILTGQNDHAGDYIYNSVKTSVFNDCNLGYYKHWCGEYHTSTAFAAWVAAQILRSKEIPRDLILQKKRDKSPKNVLIWNHFRNISHSLILLSEC